MSEAARILAVREHVLANLPKVTIVCNLAAVARHAIRPTVGVDTTGQPAARDCHEALAALRRAA